MYFYFVRNMAMIVSCLMMFFSSAYPKLPDDEMRALTAARETLQQVGIEVPYEAFCAAKWNAKSQMDFFDTLRDMPEDETEFWLQYAQEYQKPERRAYDMLVSVGIGRWNDLTWKRTPYSNQVYVFDAEISDVANMYADFLYGIDGIIPDAAFSDIVEDLSGVTGEMSESESWLWTDGTRKVSFRCNGKLYEKELISYYDWIDMGILAYVNQVLRQNGCVGQLHSVGHEGDQMVVLIYGSEEYASSVRKAIGTEEEKRNELTQWLLDLLF